MNKNITTYNKYHAIASLISKRYLDTPNLIGIIWIGSSSYEIYDKSTDIDIRLIVAQEKKDFVMPQFKEDGIKIEVDMISLNWLLTDLFPDSEQFWIREKAKILYDSKNILKNEFKKANSVDNKIYSKMLWSLYKEIFHSYDYKKTFMRKDNITAYMYIFKTIDALSKFAFIYQKKPVPTFKWRWYFIRKEKLLNESIMKIMDRLDLRSSSEIYSLIVNIEENVQKMMRIKNYSAEKVEKPWLL